MELMSHETVFSDHNSDGASTPEMVRPMFSITNHHDSRELAEETDVANSHQASGVPIAQTERLSTHKSEERAESPVRSKPKARPAKRAYSPQPTPTTSDKSIHKRIRGGPTESVRGQRGVRYFIIKSFNYDHIQKSVDHSLWATQPRNEAKLNDAFKVEKTYAQFAKQANDISLVNVAVHRLYVGEQEVRQVILIFSVNESRHFQGYAEMTSGVTHESSDVFQSHGGSRSFVGGTFGVDWLCIYNCPFNSTTHITNPWNEGKPVKISRDGQELPPNVGRELCDLIAEGARAEAAAGTTPEFYPGKRTPTSRQPEQRRHRELEPPRAAPPRQRGHRSAAVGGRSIRERLGAYRHSPAERHAAPHYPPQPMSHSYAQPYHAPGQRRVRGSSRGEVRDVVVRDPIPYSKNPSTAPYYSTSPYYADPYNYHRDSDYSYEY